MSQAHEQPHWHSMPTQVLLEQAWAFADQQHDSEAARCIVALAWRLRGSEEWIESLNRRTSASKMEGPK